MSITLEATYENGVLKPLQPLPLAEHEKVKVTVHTGISVAEQTAGMLKWTGDRVAVSSLDSPILQAYGIMGWKGTSEELDRLLAEIDEDEVS